MLTAAAPTASTAASLPYDLTFGMLAMSGLPTACALGAFAVIARRSGELPPVTVVLAVVADGAHVLLLASFVVGTGFLSLEGQVVTVVPGLLFAWILATGLALLRRPSAPRRLGPAGVRPRAAS